MPLRKTPLMHLCCLCCVMFSSTVVSRPHCFSMHRQDGCIWDELHTHWCLCALQAMTCGLVTFATDKGGPAEIIEQNKSGFNIDPYHGEAAAELMADFFEKCAKDQDHWREMSDGAIERIRSHYTWKIYAERLMTLSRVYRSV